MPLDRRNAAMQARIQIKPRASWVASERRGPGVRRPKLAITTAWATTRMQDAPIRPKENPRGALSRTVRMECTGMGPQAAQGVGACYNAEPCAFQEPTPELGPK